MSDQTPWMKEARKHNGKTEHDPKFRAVIVPFWKKLWGLNFKTIVGTSFAWCGLFAGMVLYNAGMPVQSRGAAAVSWMNYGQKIDWKTYGVPEGAIVELNHNFKCGNSKGNHVAFANGNCSAADITKAGATIGLFGGNQGNTAKVSVFNAKEICAVRWPSNYPLPGKVVKSERCSTKALPSSESTR